MERRPDREDRAAGLPPPLAVALDFASGAEALVLAKRLGGRAAYMKVGLELYTAEGPGVVSALRDMGHRVFLDIKLHDIPNTVARAVAVVRRAGVSLLTVHASGGPAMLHAAAEAAHDGGGGAEGGLHLLGVTVLTSLDQADLAATGVADRLGGQVLRLADLAVTSGLDGVVASAREAARLRSRYAPPFLIVTPGIRPTWHEERGDQGRVTTPRQAIVSGADLIVVGRPITSAPEPILAAERVGAELREALRERSAGRDAGVGRGNEG